VEQELSTELSTGFVDKVNFVRIENSLVQTAQQEVGGGLGSYKDRVALFMQAAEREKHPLAPHTVERFTVHLPFFPQFCQFQEHGAGDQGL
jgi:hypothetical protein